MLESVSHKVARCRRVVSLEKTTVEAIFQKSFCRSTQKELLYVANLRLEKRFFVIRFKSFLNHDFLK